MGGGGVPDGGKGICGAGKGAEDERGGDTASIVDTGESVCPTVSTDAACRPNTPNPWTGNDCPATVPYHAVRLDLNPIPPPLSTIPHQLQTNPT